MEQDSKRIEEDLDANGEYSGVEKEEDNISEPFNPDRIDIVTETLPLEKFIRRLKQDKIELAPDFQRNQVWIDKQKSQLIESMILNIPLPMFYVSVDEDEKWSVVDGLQRFSAIRDFILGTDKSYYSSAQFPYKGDGFKLKEMEFFEDYNDKYFKDLPEHIQNRILDSDFTITVIKNGTPEQVKFNIFKRINTGGMPLSSQEIRHALYQGEATKILIELSENKAFLNATNHSIKPTRMADRELILRLISFIIRGVDSFKTNKNMEIYLNETMNIINYSFECPRHRFQSDKDDWTYFQDLNIMDIADIKDKFSMSMERAGAIFGHRAFRRSIIETEKTAPINKALFDSLGYILSNISEQTFEILLSNKKKFLEKLNQIVNVEYDFAFGKDASKYSGVRTRFDKLASLIKEIENEGK